MKFAIIISCQLNCYNGNVVALTPCILAHNGRCQNVPQYKSGIMSKWFTDNAFILYPHNINTL